MGSPLSFSAMFLDSPPNAILTVSGGASLVVRMEEQEETYNTIQLARTPNSNLFVPEADFKK